MSTNVKTVCGVLTAKCLQNIHHLDAHLQMGLAIIVKKPKMPNNGFTMSIFHTRVLTYLPIQ
jgi:hypothetical protein